MIPAMPGSTGMSEAPTSEPMRRRRGEMRVGADRGGDRGKAVARQEGGELLLDALNEARPLEDERGIELHQRCAGANLLIGVGTRGDAADADDRQLAAGEAIHLGEQ